MHPREFDKVDKITGRPPIKIRTKRPDSVPPKQKFWTEKNALGWPGWMIDEKWEELEAAKRAALEKAIKAQPKKGSK